MKRDIYREVTDKMVSAIEAGIASGDKWSMPWRKLGAGGRPKNATSGHVYRGINVALLWGAADEAGFEDGRWATFNQWKAVGASVRKGSKGAPIVFYKKLAIVDKATGEAKNIPLLRQSYVFNVAQVDNAPDRITNPVTLTDNTLTLEGVDAFISATGAVIKHGGDQAFFSPSRDIVQMPERMQFKGDTDIATQRYYSTLLHELTHWTGHKSRLDRNLINGFGTAAYAQEELVAELGAAFLCADLGISNEPRDDHAHYLASWLKVMKDDSRAIFKAASAAEKACDLLKGTSTAEVEPEADTPTETPALALAA